jgi:hypothetical protein
MNTSTSYLYNNFCVPTCPSTTFANATTITCDSCHSPCDTCTSLTNCSTCVGGYYLYLNTCTQNCPTGYVGVVTTCQLCNTGCRTCQTTTTYCLNCLSGYYLLSSSNECVKTCPTGLFQDPSTLTCIGCSGNCTTCSGSANNCTSCTTGVLYLNSCVANCPDAYYAVNGQCLACPTGCLTCTSGSSCQSCLGSYFLYQNVCISTCPSTHALVVNQTCTACSTPNCQSCNSGDQCLVCNSPSLLYVGSCVSSCPENFTSNGTSCVNSVMQAANTSLNSTLSSSKLFPMPFSIAGAVVIMLCVVSKFQNGNTFASGAIYALLGIFEWGALGVFGLLYWMNKPNKFDLVFFIIVGSMGALYLMNIITFLIFLSSYYRSDIKFKSYLNKSCGNRISYTTSLIICLLICHKYVNILFTKLFNFNIFKAQLINVSRFAPLHVISSLSLFHSFSAIGVAAYVSYNNSSASSQLFLSGVDVIVVTVINVVMAGANAHKDDSFFIEKESDYTLNKKIIDNDEFMAEGIQPDG